MNLFLKYHRVALHDTVGRTCPLGGLLPVLFLSSLVAVLSSANALAQTTRHQAFNLNPTGTSDIGIRYWNATVGATDTVNSSDGQSLLLFDSLEFSERIPKAGGGLWAYDTEIRLPFVGSGIDVLHLKDTLGESYDWEVVSSGSNNTFSVVASGSVNTNTANPMEQLTLATVNLVPQGTLPTDRIHMLRVKAKDTDNISSAVGGNWRVFIDAIDVYDETPLLFDDDSNFSGNWAYGNPTNWDIGFADSNMYEATRSGTASPGETVEISFDGTSFALYGFSWTFIENGTAGLRITGTYDWEVDGGAGGFGTVDSSIDVSAAVRWPELLVNGLPSGPHTLSITVDGTGTTGMYPGNLGYSILDALAVFDSGIVNNPDFDSDGDVDGRDFLTWQRGFGMTGQTDNSNGDANGDGTVDSMDLSSWQAQYGVAPLVANSIVVPEPSGIAFFAIGMVLAGAARNLLVRSTRSRL